MKYVTLPAVLISLADIEHNKSSGIKGKVSEVVRDIHINPKAVASIGASVENENQTRIYMLTGMSYLINLPVSKVVDKVWNTPSNSKPKNPSELPVDPYPPYVPNPLPWIQPNTPWRQPFSPSPFNDKITITYGNNV